MIILRTVLKLLLCIALFLRPVTSSTMTVTTSAFKTCQNSLTNGDTCFLKADTTYAGVYYDSSRMIYLDPARGISFICADVDLIENIRCVFDGGSNTHAVFVIVNVPAGNKLLFSGIVIKNGQCSACYGGGMYIYNSASIIENTLFQNNKALVSEIINNRNPIISTVS